MTKRNEFSRAKSEHKTKQKDRKKQTQDTSGPKQYRNKAQEVCAPVVGLTAGQVEFIKAIKCSTVVFVTGCPGTGKTFISTALTADSLIQGEINKVVCTRPMISCGNDIGILPGDVDEKFTPYMMPIMDVFNQRIGKSAVECLIKNKQIQHIPLQLMRGSSIDNAVILADEMQNSTSEQLEMLLTRIGKNCTLIINGDIRQKDIPNSGMQYAINKLKHIDGISHVQMGVDDIVRSGIVKEIVKAFWGE